MKVWKAYGRHPENYLGEMVEKSICFFYSENEAFDWLEKHSTGVIMSPKGLFFKGKGAK